MKLTKCPNNHYYDADKYKDCPHCKENATPQLNSNQRNKTNKGTENTDIEDKKENKVEDTNEKRSKGHSFFKWGKNAQTHSLWSDDEEERIKSQMSQEENLDDAKEENTSPEIQINNYEEEKVEKVEKVENALPSTLDRNIEQVALSAPVEDIKTVAYYDFDDDIEPVVGWLVVINTSSKGRSFNLTCNKNTLGRTGNGNIVDISLDEDTTISRGTQAIIIYEPRERQFFLQTSNGKTLLYHNDQLVMTFVELNAYDKISIGKTQLVFVPLCGSKFSWDE